MLVLQVLILFCPVVISKEILDDTKLHIDNFMNRFIKCRGIPGLSLGVVLGNTKYAAGYGWADVENKRPVDNKTLFNIGSITKSFTAAVLADIMDKFSSKDSFTWESKIKDLLGTDYKFVDEIRTSQTTLKDLLTHRTGLAKGDLGLHCGYSENVTREDLSKRIKFLPEVIPFRDSFHYNNMMYMLAAHVAEKKTGKTWEELVQERIFDHLGMNSSTFLPSFPTRENIAFPYGYGDDAVSLEKQDLAIYSLHPVDPAGSICSNSEDMTNWLTFILSMKNYTLSNELGIPYNPRISETMSEQVLLPLVRAYRNVQPPVFPVDDLLVAYGMGWMTSYYRGLTNYHHSGDVYSYSSMVWLLPDINLGLYVSVNGPDTFQIFSQLNIALYYLTDILGGYQPWLNATTACTFPLPWKQAENYDPDITGPSDATHVDSVNAFTGVYGHGFLEDLVIEKAEDTQGLRFRLGKYLTGELLGTQTPGVLKAKAEGPLMSLKEFKRQRNLRLEFLKNSSSNVFERVTVWWDSEPYSFKRGLRFRDAIISNSSDSFATFSIPVICFWVVGLFFSKEVPGVL